MASLQSSLFAKPTEGPDKGYRRYAIEVSGTAMYADVHPHYLDGMVHIAFQSKYHRLPNPLSETGYLSYFVMGSMDGMSDDEVLRSLDEIVKDILNG